MAYTDAQRAVQDQFDTRRLADRIDQLLVHDFIDPGSAAFIEARDMMFVASVDASGQPTASYKGGEPGFVRVLDPHTLAFPSYDGNGMFLTLGNLDETAQVGLLFIDFEHPSRIRVQGRATVSTDDPLLPSWPGAQGCRPRTGHGSVPQLPAVHPSDAGGGAVTIRPERRHSSACTRLEALRLGLRRAARERPSTPGHHRLGRTVG